MNLIFESQIGQLRLKHNGMAITTLHIDFICLDTAVNPLVKPEERYDVVAVNTAVKPRERHDNWMKDHDDFSQTILEYLTNYFQGTSELTTPPLSPDGTSFQKKIWKRLTQINIGETISYGQLALELNTHPRAIALACRNNPISIFIPCHRVVAKNGIGGFMGSKTGHPVKIKEWLLLHEKSFTTVAKQRRKSH